MSAPVDVLAVTGEQMDRIDAAWAICSYGNPRKAEGKWARSFNECVAHVLGYEPPATFTLARVQGGAE